MHFLRKGRCRTKKRPIQKKGHCRTSPLKNGLAKLPCFLKILASWGDFFDNGLLIYPFSDHTIQCCTQKPFWVAKLEPRSCSASAFPYFEADAELGVIGKLINSRINLTKRLSSICFEAKRTPAGSKGEEKFQMCRRNKLGNISGRCASSQSEYCMKQCVRDGI